MAEKITITVDAMGGDNAPAVVLEGVRDALVADPDLTVILCGPAEVVEPFAAQTERCEAQATTEVIDMAEHPATAVRRKKDSSIVVGCRLVKEGKAQGFFSAGSTGACLAAGTLVMGRIRGIARPALAAVLPAPSGPVILCDTGANADCKPEYLLQFGRMASIYATKILGIENPRISLLNIGEEETKGSSLAIEAHKLMAESLPGFVGNAEGRDLLTGEFDIIVADGFTGNVALKTVEGTVKVLMGEVKKIFLSSAVTKLAALAVKGGVSDLKKSLSSDTYGGAPLLGVKGACIVGHGSSSALAIKNGILTSTNIARSHVSDVIAQAVAEQVEQKED